MTELQGQIALVTGASRGIGRAIAHSLAESGATVVGTATSDTGAAAIQSWLGEIGGVGRTLDVTNGDSIDGLLKSVREEFGAITILVNNAGITRDNLLMRMSEDDWDLIQLTNLKSVFRLSKACIRDMMKARGGRIINITSVVGVTGNAGQANYAAAKAGVIGFTKSMAQEVASRGITVNAVAPGFIATDMTAELPESVKQELTKAIPLGRLGQPQDIADAVVYLAGRGGHYVTGQTLHVNGGMLMT
ncbi:3-oxoacyl-ACP reductase FabG [Gammaproteobacteria bacterium]|nr:3-oxoacyl-ACP reductase FabG [Gammaproteobacteria bacterium]